MLVIAYALRNVDISSKYIKSCSSSLRYKHYKDQANCLISRIIIRYLLWDNFPKFYRNKIKYTKGGKPYLEGIDAPKFSISYSENIIIVAISSKSIGIDIEKIIQLNNRSLYLISENAFNDEEFLFFKTTNNIYDRNLNFFKLWTAKEAILKYLGIGLSTDIKKVKIEINNNMIKHARFNKQTYNIKQINICDIGIASICTHDKITNPNIIELSDEKLLIWYEDMII